MIPQQRLLAGVLLLTSALLFLTFSALQAQPAPLLSVSPQPDAEGVWLGSPVRIEFSRPMNHASVESHFSLDPAVAGHFVWSTAERGESVEFRPVDILAAETTYDVTLGAGIRDANGQVALSTDYAWSFTTGEAYDAISFGQGTVVQLVDPDGLNSVEFWPGYPRITIDFALYRLEPADFTRRYADLEPYSSEPIDVEGLEQVATWTQAYSDDRSGLQTADIPAGVPLDIYVLTASHPSAGQDEMYLILSRNVLAVKRGNSDQVVVWANQLQAQTAMPGMQVTLYDEEGSVLDEGTTDGDGVVKLNASRPRMAVGKTASETTVAGLDGAWRSDGQYWYWWWDGWSGSTPNRYRVYLHTDRPIYRPAHTVHYAGIVRRDLDGAYEPVDASIPMTATLRDSRNNVVGTQALTADEFGTVNGEFELAPEPPLGTYTLELSVAGEAYSHPFQVEAYRKPEYEVEVTTPASFAIAGDDIPVTVSADYFFGQPVADADLVLKIYRSYSYYWWSSTYGEQIGELRGTTDANGQWTTVFSTEGVVREDSPLTFQAEVTDPSRQPVKGSLGLPVYWNTYRLALSTEKYGYEADEPIVASIAARTHEGEPVAGEPVAVTLARTYPEEEIIALQDVTTDAQGDAAATFVDVEPGWYQLTATAEDGRGRRVESQRWVWIFDPDYNTWWYRSDDELTISTDKDAYAPGETAQLLIQSQVTGIALMTLERGTVHEERIVPLTDSATVVPVEVTADFSPNIFATVHIFQPAEEDDQPYYWENKDEGRLLMAQTELTVPATDQRLTVEVMPQADRYLPGDQAGISIHVTDAAGQPVRARVALALVDEAIFALAEDTSPGIFETFYGRRSDGVVTYDSLSPTRYVRGPEYDVPAPGPAPTPTPTGADRTATPEIEVRREFPDTAYWNPSIETGADGTAKITVPLPDNLTTWRIIAKAVTLETEVGDATSEILVTKDVLARPALPRFTVLGDEFALDAIGQNFSGQAVSGTMTVDAPALTLLDGGAQAVDLPHGGSDVAHWTAVASEIGDATVNCQLETPAGNDAVELTLPVQPFAVPERAATAGQADPVAVETFDVPFNAVQDASSITIRLSPSIALGLLDGLEYLIDYPYGCVEQTMSRVLPSAVAAKAYQDLGIPNPKAGELPDIIDQGLQKLYGFQHDDGSWGWWYDDEGGVYMTAYVLFGLTAVEQAGFDVDNTVLNRGFDFLNRRLGGVEDPRIEAYALYVKSVAGRGDLAAAQALLSVQDKLDHFSRAALALTLDAEGDPSAAQMLADRLEADAVETPSTAHWPASTNHGSDYYWRTMASAEKSTALAVVALTELRPESRLLPKAVRWLMNHRVDAGWRDTQATAFAVIGLTDYILVAGELEADYAYTVSLNGQQIGTGSVTPETATDPIDPIVISGDQLLDAENTLRIERDGDGQLYYTVAQQLELFYDGFEPVSSVDQGLKISRAYRLVEGAASWSRPPDQASGDNGMLARSETGQSDTEYGVGDLVEVHLTVEAKDEAWYVIVEDALPAGFEALNERMNPVGYSDIYPPFRWPEWGYNRKNVYDDRVTFFVTRLWSGRHEFTYLMRAVTPGTFSVLPAEAYPMYSEEMWGRSGSQQVSVAPQALTPRPDLAGDFDRNCRVTNFDARQVAGAFGSANRARDVDGDGIVDLRDVAGVAGRAGATCVADQAQPGPGVGRVELAVQPETDAVTVGQTFTVDVALEEADALGGFGLALTFDPARLHVTDVTLDPAVTGGLTLGPHIDNPAGRVALGVYGSADVEAGARLATVTFVARRAGEVQLGIQSVQAVDGQGRALDASASLEGSVSVRGQTWLLPLVQR